MVKMGFNLAPAAGTKKDVQKSPEMSPADTVVSTKYVFGQGFAQFPIAKAYTLGYLDE